MTTHKKILAHFVQTHEEQSNEELILPQIIS